jgi:hypothetical protein
MPEKFRTYWWLVVTRAATDASSFVGTTPKKAAFGFFTTLAAFAIGFSFLGDEVWQKIIWAAISLIPGTTIFFRVQQL